MALQHQHHHVFLAGEDLTELLPQAGCFLQAPVDRPGPVPALAASRLAAAGRVVAEVQDLGLGVRGSGAPESGGGASERVAPWVRTTE